MLEEDEVGLANFITLFSLKTTLKKLIELELRTVNMKTDYDYINKYHATAI